MKTIEEVAKDFAIKIQTNPDTISRLNAESWFTAGIEFAQRWIPVSGQLPLVKTKYLVKTTSSDILLLSFNVRFNCWDDEEGDDCFCDAIGGIVTHWRPIELK